MGKIKSVIPSERIEQAILLFRREKVMLDADLAEMYGVPVYQLVQAVKRNLDRFPKDFMFQLSLQEVRNLRSQSVISSLELSGKIENSGPVSPSAGNVSLRVNGISKTQTAAFKTWGGRRTRPYVFTEQGVAMLSSVLNSPQAVAVNIEIIRTFVRLRKMIASHVGLARKLAALEKKYDAQFKVVFDAIRELMVMPAPTKKRRIGF